MKKEHIIKHIIRILLFLVIVLLVYMCYVSLFVHENTNF